RAAYEAVFRSQNGEPVLLLNSEPRHFLEEALSSAPSLRILLPFAPTGHAVGVLRAIASLRGIASRLEVVILYRSISEPLYLGNPRRTDLQESGAWFYRPSEWLEEKKQRRPLD